MEEVFFFVPDSGHSGPGSGVIYTRPSREGSKIPDPRSQISTQREGNEKEKEKREELPKMRIKSFKKFRS